MGVIIYVIIQKRNVPDRLEIFVMDHYKPALSQNLYILAVNVD